MNEKLETYLNDHLAGSVGGLMLATKLAETATDPAEKMFFQALRDKISEDRKTLEDIIESGGYGVSSTRQTMGAVVGHIGLWRMAFNGLEEGNLGRFEMIELLAIGIHGKHLLWRALGDLGFIRQEWEVYDFHQLEAAALEQRAAIEIYRLSEGRISFGQAPT